MEHVETGTNLQYGWNGFNLDKQGTVVEKTWSREIHELTWQNLRRVLPPTTLIGGRRANF